jgi:ribosomal protein S21
VLLSPAPMAINAEVVKNDNETAVNLIRRFSKRVQGVGLIQLMRKRRYYARSKSSKVQRKHALKVLRRREEVADLIKMGKLVERLPGERRPSKR